RRGSLVSEYLTASADTFPIRPVHVPPIPEILSSFSAFRSTRFRRSGHHQEPAPPAADHGEDLRPRTAVRGKRPTRPDAGHRPFPGARRPERGERPGPHHRGRELPATPACAR